MEKRNDRSSESHGPLPEYGRMMRRRVAKHYFIPWTDAAKAVVNMEA
jgi:hypothetical protein